ncbi:MAG: CoA transferase [Streptosporangiales bacterium]|nr:CoA transferase [Streptosporangiales bacterium]
MRAVAVFRSGLLRDGARDGGRRRVRGEVAVASPAHRFGHIFDGVRVLDFTQVLAGPTVTRLMAEMGAEVLKVELPPRGDISRALPYQKSGRSGYYIQQNRGKKSLCVDVKSGRGKEIITELLPHVDIVVESFSPGTMASLGFGYEAVSEVNPRIIMCSVSAFGQKGGFAGKPGYDNVAQAYSGITSMVGAPGAPPSLTNFAVGDVTTGVYGLAAVASALFHRERSGQGQHVDVSLLDSYFNCHEVNVQAYSGSDGEIRPTRSGSHHYAVSPFGIYRATDGYIFIAVPSDHQWPHICRAMGRTDLIDDPRYRTNAGRVERLPEVVELIEGWLAGLSGVDEAIRILESERVPVAPILTVEQAVQHPYLRERRTVRSVEDRVWGQLDVPGIPLRFSAFPTELPLQAPFLGEHNQEVLSRYLGYGSEAYRELKDAGVLVEEPR